MKFSYLIQPDNLANVLVIRRDILELVETYNFTHQDALSLLTPRSFKIRIEKIHNNQTSNLYRWNKTWDDHIREKSKLENPFASQKGYLSKLERRFLKQKAVKPEAYFELIIECNDLQAYIDSTNNEIFTNEEI